MKDAAQPTIDEVLTRWENNESRCKDCFLRLKNHCSGMNGICLKWVARPGVTYSLRAAHSGQTSRDLFAMVDIIDDDPAQRWLSVCFYDDLVSDPDDLGDFVPGGLLGQDARCFDVDSWDDGRLAYVEARLTEACKAAAGS